MPSTTRKASTKKSFWYQTEYLMAACAVMPLVAGGMDLVDALAQVQQDFPTSKQRSPEQLKRTANSRPMTRAFKEAQHMAPTLRAEQVEKMKGSVLRSKDFVPSVKGIHWTDLEWALVLRRVRHFQQDMGDTRSVQLLAVEAQYIELPPERWRKKSSLVALTGDAGGSVDSHMKHLTPRLHTLLAGIPFEAAKKAQTAPLALPVAIPPQEAPPTAPNPAFEREPTPAPAPRRKSTRPHKTRSELPGPFDAPTPPPVAPRAPVEAPALSMSGFGAALGSMIEAVATKAAEEAVTLLEPRLRRMAETLVAAAIGELDRRVQSMVKATLERSLGSGIEVVEGEQPVSLEGQGLPEVIKMDVVGLVGQQITEVKQALNGYADAIRFIDANQVSTWEPRGTVILNTKFISHDAEHKCRKWKVKPVRVYGTSTAVLNAIRALYEVEGIDLPLHS